MNEDKSLDVLGLKPLSKAVEKFADKSVDGIGTFFGAICMPAAEEFGLLLRDKIAAFRRKNLESIVEKSKQKIEDQKISVNGEANPVLLREVIEEASWSEDASIQSMWAGLLADASSKRAIADDSLVYTDTLKRITPFQARLVNCIYSDPRCCSVKPPMTSDVTSVFYPENRLTYSVIEVLGQYPGDLSKIVPIANTTHDKIIETKEVHILPFAQIWR